MPAAKARRTIRRKVYRKRRIPGGKLAPNKQIGFPNIQTIRMRYCDVSAMTCNVGVMANDDYYANALYKVYVPVLIPGHQPMGYDQACAYYQDFTVISSRARVVFSWNSNVNNTTHPVKCGVYMYTTADDTPYTDYLGMEEAGVQVKTLGNNTSRVVCHANYTPRKCFGAFLSDSTLVGNVTNNPARLAAYRLWIQTADGVSNSVEVTANITIDYIVKCNNKQVMAQS